MKSRNKKFISKRIFYISVIAIFLLTAITVAQLSSLRVNSGEILSAEKWNALVTAVENAAKNLPEPVANTDAATKAYVGSYVDAASGVKIAMTFYGKTSCPSGWTELAQGSMVQNFAGGDFACVENPIQETYGNPPYSTLKSVTYGYTSNSIILVNKCVVCSIG